MKIVHLLIISIKCLVISASSRGEDDVSLITVLDLTQPTTWKDLSNYYSAVYKHWKICVNCGIPGLGTSIHLEYGPTTSSMRPAIIPTEYLVSRLIIVDVSHLSRKNPGLVLNLDVALQWNVLKRDPQEPTLVIFKFNWKEKDNFRQRCVCKIPGLSYELAEWIATNLTHVVGVATDAPTLESDQTRERVLQTVSNVLGKSGVYMIENVNLRRRLPEHGCMAIAMPLMMLEASYVPTRLTAFCPTQATDEQVTIALKKIEHNTLIVRNRVNPINLKEIMNLT